MAKEYRIIPKTKSLWELRGIEEISLFFPDARKLAETEIDQVIVDCQQEAVTLRLKTAGGFDEKLKQKLADGFSRLLNATCRVEVVGKEEPPVPLKAGVTAEGLTEALKEKFPAVFAWFASPPLTLDQDGRRIVLRVNSPLAVDYIRPREKQILGYLQQVAGKSFKLCYEVEEEPLEVPPLPDFPVELEAPGPDSPSLAESKKTDPVLLGKKVTDLPVAIKEIGTDDETVVLEGEVLRAEVRTLKSGRKLLIFDLTDYTDSITVKAFATNRQDPSDRVQPGMWLRVQGNLQYDEFAKETVVMARNIQQVPAPQIKDEAAEKRVELHLHTKMSAMDSIVELEKAVQTAAAWGHPALAVTDHGVVYAFPEAARLGRKYGIKILYGMEGYLVNDQEAIVTRAPACSFQERPVVVVDIETTGLNPQWCELLEIGAVKIENGEVTATFEHLVRPQRAIPYKIQQLTGITEEMVKEAASPAEVLADFLKFVGDGIFVAHNAQFDFGFLREKIKQHLGAEFKPPVVDTLALSRILWPELKSHRLDVVAKELGIGQEHHHRAGDDALTAWRILEKGLALCTERAITTWPALNALNQTLKTESLHPYHIIILVKDQTGLRNLYRLVSISHLEHFHRHPRIPRSLLLKYREGLLLGSACEAGELFTALLNGVDEREVREIASFYDFLEIQPLANNDFLIREGRLSREQLMELNRTICRLGEELGKPVVATGDVHILRPEDAIFRRVLLAGQGYEDAEEQPPLYFRTTEEMLAEFAYLGEELARRVVITNPQQIASALAEVKPVPDEFCPPQIPGADEEIRTTAYRRAEELYGSPLPSVVVERLELELKSIIGHGYAVLYLIAEKLVKKSLADGYLVGSRGSVGSSFVATMCGITEVNPLPAHYRCAKCFYSEFMETGAVGSGYDLPDKDCPRCGAPLIKDGQDIQFATFMGFEGDKEPDIDLNFSGEYQPVVLRYTEELFGKGNVFRAGTITGLAEKTAFGFVRGYMEEQGLHLRQAEINRLVQGCTGVRRSSGQHPGGMIVVPQGQEIYNFTPVQYPANDRTAEWITTHFDYHGALEGHLVKLDILGHDDPTVIRMLQDLTGIDPKTIPMDDRPTMKLFSSVEPLGIDPEELGCDLGTLGIPEFGTEFARQMLEDTRPQTFAELVYISGLSHGTNVWLGNAQELIKNKQATLMEVISTRDKIMNDLIYRGVPPKTAFTIMEKVRKGRGLNEDDIKLLKEYKVPQWYIDSCLKIRYLFPKAHAVAYVMMGFRIAYFKVHYPEAFYATFFSIRSTDFPVEPVLAGPAQCKKTMKELKAKGNEMTAKEKGVYATLEVAYEALLRGIRFLPVDLYRSDATRFLLTPQGLLMPLTTIQGLGEAAARTLVEAREGGAFCSVEDLKTRARLSSAVIEMLERQGCLQGLPATNQLSLF
ncbi:MAG TPA: PolC-type DNA polymerase III [Capillibacterium sp.]